MTSAIQSPLPATFSQDVFERFLASRQEPGWLTDLRRSAFETYAEKLGEPLDPEEFKRVDLRTFRPEKFSIAATEPDASTLASFGTLLQGQAEFAGNVSHV